jgi:hypothetical protein
VLDTVFCEAIDLVVQPVLVEGGNSKHVGASSPQPHCQLLDRTLRAWRCCGPQTPSAADEPVRGDRLLRGRDASGSIVVATSVRLEKGHRQRGNATLCAHVVEDTLEGDHLQAITADDQEETHAAFAATLPALTVSDTACAQVDAAAAAFADSVSDAINIASEASSAVNAISKAKAFALNAASKAAFAKRV